MNDTKRSEWGREAGERLALCRCGRRAVVGVYPFQKCGSCVATLVLTVGLGK